MEFHRKMLIEVSASRITGNNCSMNRGQKTAITLILSASFALSLTTSQVAATPTITNLMLETTFKNLQLPVGTVDGKWDGNSQRAICAWREMTGRSPSRKTPTIADREAIAATTALKVRTYFRLGMNINRTCQTGTWIKLDPITKAKRINAVWPVSTGRPGYETPSGRFTIRWQLNKWHESSIYEGAMMYRPKYFAPSVALHGSFTDSLVRTYPDSHGCVRMLHSSIDALWRAHFDVGSPVFVYGVWVA
jgi:lipoprotein-anchoring transpeptidase ErfK/SrfK